MSLRYSSYVIPLFCIVLIICRSTTNEILIKKRSNDTFSFILGKQFHSKTIVYTTNSSKVIHKQYFHLIASTIVPKVTSVNLRTLLFNTCINSFLCDAFTLACLTRQYIYVCKYFLNL